MWAVERLPQEIRQELAKLTIYMTINYLAQMNDMDFVRNGDYIHYVRACVERSSLTSPRAASIKLEDEVNAKACFYLGRAYWVMWELENAETLFRKAKTSSEIVWGPSHPWTLWACNNLGLISKEQNKLTQACEYFEEAIRGMITTFGHGSKLVATARANLSESKELQILDTWDRPRTDINNVEESMLVEPETLLPKLFSTSNSIHLAEGELTRSQESVRCPENSEINDFETAARSSCEQCNEYLSDPSYQTIRGMLNWYEERRQGYWRLSATSVHLYAASYILLSDFSSALALYKRAVPTYEKVSSYQDMMNGLTLRDNLDLLSRIIDPPSSGSNHGPPYERFYRDTLKGSRRVGYDFDSALDELLSRSNFTLSKTQLKHIYPHYQSLGK
jgi:tetratricopeptide (TPR) repeat protein